MTPTVEVFQSSGRARVYRLPMEVFPGFWAFAHLVVADGFVALIDAGSGFGLANEHLEAAFTSVRRQHGEAVDLASLTHVLITHAHIDHFGGLPFVRSRSRAPIGVHELDLRVLTNYEQRLAIVAHRLKQFLLEAGVPAERQETLMSLYLLNKQLFSSMDVDFVFQGVEGSLGPLHWLHVPGHCPGHVVFRIDDILLVGDHVLPEISPHQSPERLSHFTGLAHYLDSLDRALAWAPGVKIALGGHQGPIRDLPARAAAIRELHAARLERVLELLQEPSTVAEVGDRLFPNAQGYHALLAIEEAGAHVEYLEQRGHLVIENLGHLHRGDLVPIRHQRRAGPLLPQPLVPQLEAIDARWRANLS
ncbi:MAG: MBL fold metallo-hydrolase [Chloroflexota bacterium]